MRKLCTFILALLALLATSTAAQTTNTSPQRFPRRVPSFPIEIEWDASRTYRQIVVLFDFKDTDFMKSDPKAYYSQVLNEKGFNDGAGPGCVADYILAQSNGLLHIQFDVFGPYKIKYPAKNNANLLQNNGFQERQEATQLFFEANPTMDYSIYDWNGDGQIEQIVYIYAGTGGDTDGDGYIWPNTGMNLSSVKTPDGLDIRFFSLSAEACNKNGKMSRGFGTMLHEYAHCLGLPDVYPVQDVNDIYSVADEWDLMDGGNWTNNGWCPPNFTAVEKMHLGWLTPIELPRDTIITGMKPVADGGEAYLIRHSEKEYVILENRQQTGWDYGIPGRGLTIWRVQWDSLRWHYNEVNGGRLYLQLYFADNLNYQQWKQLVPDKDKYSLAPAMRNRRLSTAAYPWSTDSTSFVNDCLTADSSPAPIMRTINENGNYMLNKHIKNIQMAEDGTISFELEKDLSESIDAIRSNSNSPARKILINGTLRILRGDRTYTVTGTRLE